MSSDDMLVEILKACPAVVAECNARVYHLEVYQSSSSLDRYPCVVYQLQDRVPENELSGRADLYHSIYDVTILAKNSTPLRTIADALVLLGDEESNDELWEAYTYLEWLDVSSDNEQNEFAVEQQEKGIKTSSLVFTLDHIIRES